MSEQPFAGITVLEFGQFVAVPFCGQLFADGGAHVIKIEPHEGDPTRQLAPLAPGETRHFLSRNRGKHSLPLELRHPLAARILDALFERADVVLMNLRPGLAADLGLDHASLSARWPRLITGNVTAFGRHGPDAGLAGMDLVVQARSGLMAAMGKIRDGLPGGGDSPIADYMAALLLGFGVATALYRREQTGEGSEVDVSLLGAAMTLTNNLILRVERADGELHNEVREWLRDAREGGLPIAEQLARSPNIRISAMNSVYYRTYATRDSAIAVACVSSGLQRRFLEATGMRDLALEGGMDRQALAQHYEAFQHDIEGVIASKTTAEWKTAFDAVGAPASPVYLPIELLDDEQPMANGLLHDMDHPAVGPVRMLGAPLHFNGDGFRPGAPTPLFGSETRSILREAGLSEEAVDEAVADGAVREAAG